LLKERDSRRTSSVPPAPDSESPPETTASSRRSSRRRARKSELGSPSSLYNVFVLAAAGRDARPRAAPQRVPDRDMMFVTSSAGGAAGTGSGPYLTKSSRMFSENCLPSTCPVAVTTILRTWSEESIHASIGR